MTTRLLLAALAAALVLPAAADAKQSCTRGGATLEAASGKVRVVRRELKTQSANETRREALLATAANSDSFVDRLYWTLSDGTIKSLDLF